VDHISEAAIITRALQSRIFRRRDRLGIPDRTERLALHSLPDNAALLDTAATIGEQAAVAGAARRVLNHGCNAATTPATRGQTTPDRRRGTSARIALRTGSPGSSTRHGPSRPAQEIIQSRETRKPATREGNRPLIRIGRQALNAISSAAPRATAGLPVGTRLLAGFFLPTGIVPAVKPWPGEPPQQPGEPHRGTGPLRHMAFTASQGLNQIGLLMRGPLRTHPPAIIRASRTPLSFAQIAPGCIPISAIPVSRIRIERVDRSRVSLPLRAGLTARRLGIRSNLPDL
jgi:hypothetical protein